VCADDIVDCCRGLTSKGIANELALSGAARSISHMEIEVTR